VSSVTRELRRSEVELHAFAAVKESPGELVKKRVKEVSLSGEGRLTCYA